MNELVELPGELMRYSLIVTGLTLRTFSAAVSDCFAPAIVQRAWATRSPLKCADPEVTLNAALMLAPGATGPAIAAELLPPSAATEVHCLGTAMLNSRPVTGAPVVFVNVTVVSCEDRGENVCSPGGVAVADAGARLRRCTSYRAAT